MKKLTVNELALYLGCLAEMEYKGGLLNNFKASIDSFFLHEYAKGTIKIKPILKPITNLTELEADECFAVMDLNPNYVNKRRDIIDGEVYGLTVIECSKMFSYLLSKSYDVFHLIEQGLAIKDPQHDPARAI